MFLALENIGVQGSGLMMQAMRLFVGEPVWTPVNRPADDHESRKKYVDSFLVAADPVAVT